MNSENQMLSSPARQNIINYHRATRNLSRGSTHFTDASWMRVVVIPYTVANPASRNDQEARIATLQGHRDTVFGIHWSRSGQLLASCSVDKSIIIWDSVGGQAITKLLGHTDDVRNVAFSPNESMLASC